MWNCQREEKERTFPQKALMCSLAWIQNLRTLENSWFQGTLIILCSQNKGLSEYQRRASWLCTAPPPNPLRQRGRRAATRARRQEATAILAPETGIFHQTVSRLAVANHVFLGSWTADICQEGCCLTSAPQRRHTAQLKPCTLGTPGKPSGQDCGGD